MGPSLAAGCSPKPGKQWAPVAAKSPAPGRGSPRRRRRRATDKRPYGGAALAGRLRTVPRPAPRIRGQAQGPHRVPRVLPLPALDAPSRRANRDHAGQLPPCLSTVRWRLHETGAIQVGLEVAVTVSVRALSYADRADRGHRTGLSRRSPYRRGSLGLCAGIVDLQLCVRHGQGGCPPASATVAHRHMSAK